ncbi:MAG: sulfotransferase domain-containing protein [Verrucomicrobiales bacterium]|nr:sulfotransferase domain-containing protein [Verrucomicrobiales bacterium]
MIKQDQRIPDFFVVGAAKSGTTSLWNWLKQHPAVFVAPNLEDKEPAYYSECWGMKDRSRYLNLFSAACSKQQIGDFSTPYLTDLDSAALIAKDNPMAKIIILIRNPVDRAYSLYNWMLNNGYESLYPFEKALEAEASRMVGDQFQPEIGYSHNFFYFHSGLYTSQIEAYKAQFNDGQIKVLLLDDMILDRKGVMNDICKFLDIDTEFVPKMEAKNRGGVPWIPTLQHKLRIKARNCSGWEKAVGIRFFLICLMRLNAGRRGNPRLASQTRKDLLFRYQEEVKSLEVLINRDLDVWKRG